MVVFTLLLDPPQPQLYQDEPHAAALRKAVCAEQGFEDTEANAEKALKGMAATNEGRARLRGLLKTHGSFTDQAITQVGGVGHL